MKGDPEEPKDNVGILGVFYDGPQKLVVRDDPGGESIGVTITGHLNLIWRDRIFIGLNEHSVDSLMTALNAWKDMHKTWLR